MNNLEKYFKQNEIKEIQKKFPEKYKKLQEILE
jgi:uncharacterized protein (UPF0216 family)